LAVLSTKLFSLEESLHGASLSLEGVLHRASLSSALLSPQRSLHGGLLFSELLTPRYSIFYYKIIDDGMLHGDLRSM
jgi:hypothetical protein